MSFLVTGSKMAILVYINNSTNAKKMHATSLPLRKPSEHDWEALLICWVGSPCVFDIQYLQEVPWILRAH